MAKQNTRLLWGLIFLVGLLLTQYGVFTNSISEQYALWGWFVIIIVSTWHLGKVWGKSPTDARINWKSILVLFVILQGSLLLGYWGVGGGALLFWSIFFLLWGAGMFASGFETKLGSSMGMGLFYLIIGLVFPSYFSVGPYAFAAVLIGVPMIVQSWKMK